MSISRARFSTQGVGDRWDAAGDPGLATAFALEDRPSTSDGGLLYRDVSGQCAAYDALKIDTSGKQRSADSAHFHSGTVRRHEVTINRSPGDLYRLWHDVENAPRFLINIESIENLGDDKSRRIALEPLGVRVSWESEVIVVRSPVPRGRLPKLPERTISPNYRWQSWFGWETGCSVA